MKALRRGAARLAGVLAGILLVAAAALALGTLVPRPLVAAPDGAAAGDGADTRRILLLANPIHTDIAIPADHDVLQRFGFVAADGLPLFDPAVEWLVFGWGGRAFYLETPTWSALKPGPLARALTLDRAVMHVALAGPIAPDADYATPVHLAPARFEALLGAVLGTFTRDEAGSPMLVAGRSYGAYDLFYEAEGWFNALVGCNVWTAGMLRDAGLRTGWWNPLPQSLGWSVRAYNEPANASSARQP